MAGHANGPAPAQVMPPNRVQVSIATSTSAETAAAITAPTFSQTGTPRFGGGRRPPAAARADLQPDRDAALRRGLGLLGRCRRLLRGRGQPHAVLEGAEEVLGELL